MDRGGTMRIYLDEITCPVCGVEHSDHQERLTLRELVFDKGICDACDNWYERVHEDTLATNHHTPPFTAIMFDDRFRI